MTVSVLLELEVEEKDVEITAMILQVDNVEGHIKIAEYGALLMLVTICEHGRQWQTADAARFRAEVAHQSAESQLQNVCLSESSLREEVGHLQSDKASIEE